jgi:hypothetical protein
VARPCVEVDEWNSFVKLVPWTAPQHNFSYGQILASCFGYLHPAYRIYKFQGKIIAGLPLMCFSAGWPFHALYSLVFNIYGGPLIHPDYLDDLRLYLKISDDIDSQAAKFGAFEARFTVPPHAPESVNQCLQYHKHLKSLKRDCPLLNLDRPMEKIRKDYKSPVRRAIRRSLEKGVIVEEDVNVSRACQAYPLYRNRMKQIGATIKPWRFLEQIIQKKLGAVFLACHGNRMIGFLMLLVSSKMAIYWISGMDSSATTFRPMNALLDSAICWSHRKRIPLFNFGESFGARPGLVRFKMGWGPEPAQNTVITRIYRPMIRQIWRALEPIARRGYAIWDQWRWPFFRQL